MPATYSGSGVCNVSDDSMSAVPNRNNLIDNRLIDGCVMDSHDILAQPKGTGAYRISP